MRLIELRSQNFAGLRDGTYSFLAADGRAARVVLVTGASGAGKTALLDAVIAAKESLIPYGAVARPDERRARSAEPVTLRTVWGFDAAEARTLRLEEPTATLDSSVPDSATGPARRALHRYAHEADVGKLDFFPAERRLAGSGVESAHLARDVPFAIQKATRLGRDPIKYGALRGWLAERSQREAREALASVAERGALFADERTSLADELSRAISRFAPAPRLLRVTAEGEMVFGGDGLPERGAEDVPGAMRAALLFVLSYAMVGHQRSVVLVDEVERGVPSGEHGRFLDALVALGGESQLIATTTSPELLGRRSREEVVIDLSSRTMQR